MVNTTVPGRTRLMPVAHDGALLVVARGTHPQATELVELRTGRRVLLPLSPLAQRSRTIPDPDTWSANTLGGDLVRVDGEGRVDFARQCTRVIEHALPEVGDDELACRALQQALAEGVDLLARLGERRMRVLLVGMQAAPNLGSDYAEAFNGIYPRLAAKHGVALYPFFLDGVAAERSYLLEDGIHPNAAGVDRMVERLLPAVEKLLAADAGKT